MWRRLRNTHVLLHVRANGDSPISLAMAFLGGKPEARDTQKKKEKKKAPKKTRKLVSKRP